MSRIRVPKRVFFDTNHLVNLSRLWEDAAGSRIPGGPCLVRDYREIMRRLRIGEITPVSTVDQTFEWCHGDRENAYRIANVFDAAQAVVDVATQTATFLIEVAAAAISSGLELAVEVPPAIDSLANPSRSFAFFKTHYRGPVEIPADLLEARGTYHIKSMRERVKWILDIHKLVDNDQKKWLQEINEAFAFTKAQSKGHKGFARRTRWRWLEDNLGIGQALASMAHSEPSEEALRRIDMATCRAFDLYCKVFWGFKQAKTDMTANDHADLLLIHAIPYAEHACIERMLCGLVRSAGLEWAKCVTSDPGELLEQLDA